MQFLEKGTMDPMNGHFSPIIGLESVNGKQFSLCGTPTNLIFAHRVEVLEKTSDNQAPPSHSDQNSQHILITFCGGTVGGPEVGEGSPPPRMRLSSKKKWLSDSVVNVGAKE